MAWPPISRDDLKIAAKRAGFDQTLPVLIRRLIAETALGLTELDMPGESGVAAGGFDGVVRAEESTAFVPEGVSVWELSVGGNDAKADDDYGKRTRGPDGRRARDCTYVEVILVPWTKSRLWAHRKSKLRRWAEVKAYNLDRVHAWLESAPATTAWLAEALGKAMPGVRSVQDWWQETWLPSTEPPLSAPVVLAGREKSAKAIVDSLRARNPIVSLGGNLRLEESMAFIASSLSESAAPGSLQALARTVVVSDETSLRQLAAQSAPLVILLIDPSLARNLPAKHPHQLIILAPPGDSSAIEVERVDQGIVARILGDNSRGNELGYLARRSLLALRRRLAVNPSVLTPTWAMTPTHSTKRFLLLGSWRGEREEDRVIVEQLVGEAYVTAIGQAEGLKKGTDFPFLENIQDEWFVVARDDAWSLIAPALDMDDLRAFQRATLEVLLSRNPVLELEADEQWKARVRGIRPPHSASIRRGISESLALMGGSDLVLTGSTSKLADHVKGIVREITENANKDKTYALWSSLSDVTQLLAEAAPSAFLAAMRGGLTGTNPIHRNMFRDSPENDALFGPSSPHTQILWALEILAWSPDYIDEVVRVLVSLDELDPGGRLSNRPRASLEGILSVWSPQTSGALEDRLRCIEIVAAQSTSGFEILLDLIPDSHPLQMSHPAPAFRDWKTEGRVTNGEISDAYRAISSTLLSGFQLTSRRAQTLIPRLRSFGKEFRTQFVERATEAASTWSLGELAAVYEAFREFVAHHNEFADAAWALSADELAPISKLRDQCEPADPARRHRWLFLQSWVTLGDSRKRDNYAAFEVELTSRRRSAMNEIYSEGGLQSAITFAEGVDPWLVGLALGGIEADVAEEVLLGVQAGGARASLAAGFLSARLRRPHFDPRSLLAAHRDITTQAFILRYVGDHATAMKMLDGLDPAVADLYWKKFSYYGLGPDFAAAKEVGWHLVDIGRPVAAIMLNLLYSAQKPADDELAELLTTALETLLAMEEPDPEAKVMGADDLERVFEVLAEHRGTLGAQRVVTLEWQLMPISSLDSVAPSIHAELSGNPSFFVELLAVCFRGASETLDREPDGGDDKQVAEGTRANAMRAWDVLRGFRQVPGVDESGVLDIEALRTWIVEARDALAKLDRAQIGDLQIGELLSHTPRGADGSPLPTPLRSLLEELANDDIMRGIALGIINGRGITTRNLEDGGFQEWAIADRYRNYASAARPWPLTRTLFEDIAERYEADARREDESAERRRQGRGL